MDKTAQDIAWRCLPLEVKKEVQWQYQIATDAKEYFTECTLGYLFGHHNLTSDAEGEVVLTVPRKDIVELYQEVQKTINQCKGTALSIQSSGIKNVLYALFGSKCLSDENSSNVEKLEKNDEDYNVDSSEQKAAGPKFKVEDEVVWDKRIIAYVDEILNDGDYIIYSRVGNRYTVHESDLEPYTEPKENPIPPNSGELNSKEADRQFDNILKDSFSKERRLNIAAMAMQGILSSEKATQYAINNFRCSDGTLNRYLGVAECSLAYADALIKEAKKGVRDV